MDEMIEFTLKMKLPKKCCDCPFAHIEDGVGEWDVYDWCQFPNKYGDADKMPLSNGRNGMSDWCPIREIINKEKMFDKYEGMPEMDWLITVLDDLRMRSSIERVGDDILVCDSLDGDEIHDGFKFAREEEHDNTELDVSKEMELLEKWYKKRNKK